MNQDDVILEYTQIGGVLEVRAVAASDGLEISFMAPVATPQEEIELIAMRKLDWVRNRRKSENKNAAGDAGGAVRRDGRGGIIV